MKFAYFQNSGTANAVKSSINFVVEVISSRSTLPYFIQSPYILQLDQSTSVVSH